MFGAFFALIAFIFRYLIIYKSQNNFDVYGHLYFIKQVKKERKGPFTSIETNILKSDKFDNPFLWHWFVGFLPTRFVAKYNKFFNPILDTLYVILIYIFTLKLGLPITDVSLIILLYITSPLFFTKLNIGPRLLFTPRLFSEVLVNIFFVLTMLPIGLSDELKITLGSVCVFLVLGSSKFGLQALLFLTPLICLFDSAYIPLICFLIGFLAILILSNFTFARSVKVQFLHLIWYFKKNLEKKTPVSKRNDLKRIFYFENNKNLFQNFVRITIRLVQDYTYSSILIKFPCFLLFLILFIQCLGAGTYPSLGIYDGPIFSSAIVFTLISLPIFLFLGEAERYISHVSYFIILGLVIIANSLFLQFILHILVVYGLVYFLLEIFFLRDPRFLRNSEDEKFLSFLKKQNSSLNLIIYPFHALSLWRVLLETPVKVLYPFHVKQEVKHVINDRYCAEYPYTDLNYLDEMVSDLGINMLLLDKRQLESKNPGLCIGDNWNELDFGGEFYSVFSRKGLEVIL